MRKKAARKLRKLADLIDPRHEPSHAYNLVLNIDADSAEETVERLTKKLAALRSAATE
jgi:hypothetical protein